MRIVSLLSSATEMLYAVGAGPEVVGISHECDYPAEVSAKPRVTFTHVVATAASGEIDRQVQQLLAAGRPLYEIDVDLLVRLRPDLIVTQAQCDVCAVRYEDVVDAVGREPSLRGVPVVSLNPMRIGDVLDDVLRIGEAVGRRENAARCIAELQGRIDTVRMRCGNLPTAEKKRTACIEWIDPPMMAGNWMPELIDWAGGVQPLSVVGHHSTYTPWDDVVRFDPEVIVIMPCGFGLDRTIAEAKRLTEFAHWHELRAVQKGRVYAVDGNSLFNRSGPRLVDSLELLASLLHPELRELENRDEGMNWRRLD